jgi:hypothetical protein
MTWRRWNFLLWPFAAPLVYLLLFHFFATAYSNKCDPGNATFFLMKNDAVTSFHPSGALVWETDGPDNGWLCDAASLSISYYGPDLNAMFDATRGNMTRNGWSESAPIPGEDFAVYQKTIDGVHLDAILRKDFWSVELHMTGPESPHFGEFGFGSS